MTGWWCRWHRARLVDYAADGLAGAPRRRLERHLAHCDACARDLAALRELPALLQAAAVPDPGEEFWVRQRQAIGRAVRNLPEVPAAEPHRPLTRSAWRYAVGLAAAAAVAVFIYRVGERHPPPVPDPLAAHTAVLDANSLIALHELLQTVVPVDEDVPRVGADDEALLAALPLDDLVGVRLPSAVPQATELSDAELEGIGNLIGGLG